VFENGCGLLESIKNAGSQGAMWAASVVQTGNEKPILLMFKKCATGCIRGEVRKRGSMSYRSLRISVNVCRSSFNRA
jgi:hypothetical protein